MEATSGGGVGAGRSAVSSGQRPGMLRVGEEGRRRKKEEGGGKKKKKKEKKEREEKRERKRERDAAEVAATTAGPVEHARRSVGRQRAAWLWREATRTQNEEKK